MCSENFACSLFETFSVHSQLPRNTRRNKTGGFDELNIFKSDKLLPLRPMHECLTVLSEKRVQIILSNLTVMFSLPFLSDY